MDYLVDLAVLGIFYHGLRLGDQLYGGWFRAVWYFYGVTLAAALSHKYIILYKERMARYPSKLQ
jgi:hypothetical protein